MFDTLTSDTDPFLLVFGVFACLLGHMSVQTYTDKYMDMYTQVHAFSATLGRRHTYTEACDHMIKPGCAENDDNRSPQAMSLRSS